MDEEFERAKIWLNNNGDFKIYEKEIKDDEGETSQIIYTVSFKKNNDTRTEKDSGEDLKKLVMNLYRNEQ
jgi:hypothetical protein